MKYTLLECITQLAKVITYSGTSNGTLFQLVNGSDQDMSVPDFKFDFQALRNFMLIQDMTPQETYFFLQGTCFPIWSWMNNFTLLGRLL